MHTGGGSDMAPPARKRARCVNDDNDGAPAAAPPPPPPVLIGEPLVLSLCFLRAIDVGKSVMVCRDWMFELSSSAPLWKEVAMNGSSKEAVEAYLASSVGAGMASSDDFRRLAISLSRKYSCTATSPLPEPTLKSDDLFFIFELQRTGSTRQPSGTIRIDPTQPRETLKSVCVTDCSAWFDQERVNVSHPLHGGDKEQPVVLEGMNQWSKELRDDPTIRCSEQNTNPVLATLARMVECDHKHFARIHLFRRTDGRSVCLLDETALGEVVPNCMHQNIDRPSVPEMCVIDFNCWECPLQFAPNSTGDLVLRLLKGKRIDSLNFSVQVQAQPILPPPKAAEELSWMKKYRRDRWCSTYLDANIRPMPDSAKPAGWTERDEEQATEARTFQYVLENLDIQLEIFQDDDVCDMKTCDLSEKEMLLIFEGLDWK